MKVEIQKTYKVALRPTKQQVAFFLEQARACRWVWNWALAEHNREHDAGGKHLTEFDLSKLLTENLNRDPDWTWMRELINDPLRYELKFHDKAWQKFFKAEKKFKKIQHADRDQAQFRLLGLPKFRKAGDRESFTFRDPQWLFAAGEIKIPKLGSVRLQERDYFPVAPKKLAICTVSLDVDRWFACVSLAEEIQQAKPRGKELEAIHLGIRHTYVTADGKRGAPPRPLKRFLAKLQRLQRQRSIRMVPGSNRCAKLDMRIKKLHQRIRNIRREYIHKTTNHLLGEHKPDCAPRRVVVETWGNAAMLNNDKTIAQGIVGKQRKNLHRAMADLSPCEIRRQLEYKAGWRDIKFEAHVQGFPSTLLCSQCGEKKNFMPLSAKVYECENCGHREYREDNSAKNVKRKSKKTADKSGVMDTPAGFTS